MKEWKLPLDDEANRLLRRANDFTGVPPWPKLFGSKSYTGRLALEYAIKTGMAPDPTYEPPRGRSNGVRRPLHTLRVDLDERFDAYTETELGSMMRGALRHYVGASPPEGNQSPKAFRPSFEFDENTVREIALLAFERRLTSVEQAARLVNVAMSRVMRHLPDPRISMRTVLAPVDTQRYSAFRSRVLDMGWDPDQLITIEVRKMLNEGITP